MKKEVTLDIVRKLIRHVREGIRTGALPMRNLNMDSQGWYHESDIQVDCGTAVCIGGWVRLALLRSGYSLPHHSSIEGLEFRNKPTVALFWNYPHDRVTKKQVLRAIDCWEQGSLDPWEVDQ